jgi:hypothetical protein
MEIETNEINFVGSNSKQPGKLAFPEYDYKRKLNLENQFKKQYIKCEASDACTSLGVDIDRENCIYKCMSNRCYKEIYDFDPLEEGEIDQRLVSFKGCFSEENNS